RRGMSRPTRRGTPKPTHRATSRPRSFFMTDSKLKRRAAPARLGVPTALLAIAAGLAGCAVGPNYQKPATSVAPQFAGAQGGPYSGADAQAKFWTEFGDDTLNRLVDQALGANHDLRIALGRLVEARAIRREARFDLTPTVTASGGYTKERFAAVDSPTGGPFNARFYDAGFDAFWELDLFGRVRRGVEAQSAEAQGAEAFLRDAQVSVTAEVARTYFELRGAQAQLAVARRNVDNQRETLKLTETRLEAGRSTELDTARAGSQLSTALVGVAVGDLFPKVTFIGSFTYAGAEPASLGSSASRGYGIGPAISWAAFDLGRVQARIAQSHARADVALAGYEQTVLRALEETENALVTHARTRESLKDAADAAQQSLTAARIARTRYEGGLVDFLEVLD